MKDIRNDSENIPVSPFQEEVVLENYFDGANRGEVFAQIQGAIKNGEEAVFMVLTGDGGSGKTMLCRLLEQEALPFGLGKTVFFPRTVDSFDDVVRGITSELGLDAASGIGYGNAGQAVDRIVAFLLSESVELLVIFDEAENMFLATLERIRKMFDRINESGARMHILFCGQKTFLENCEQLSLCDFEKADELHFTLAPLSEAGTADYLENCAARLTDTDATKVFTDEVVGNIYSLAQGNFRMTNMLGEESVKIHGDDTSFMVLLEGVKDGVKGTKKRSDGGKYSHLMANVSAYLPWIGGVAGCFLLLFYLFRPGDGANDVGPVIDKSAKTVQLDIPAVVPEAKLNIEIPEEQKPAVVETAMEMPPENLPADQVESAPAEEEAEKEIGEAEEMKAPIQMAAEKKEDIAHLQPAGEVEQNPELSPALAPVSPPQVIKREPRAKKRNVTPAITHFPAAKLYDERVSAGSAWGKKDKQDLYTVQLMLLASTSAEENLKKMLAQDNYRQEAGNFYIFKKTAAPENIFVFYGEYPTMERARLVKNSLPEFLLKDKPYALSIKGAMAKVRK
jgi:type II secretory pathway predicted ATPase ExeA/septal ring-binding cell division protein DamX